MYAYTLKTEYRNLAIFACFFFFLFSPNSLKQSKITWFFFLNFFLRKFPQYKKKKKLRKRKVASKVTALQAQSKTRKRDEWYVNRKHDFILFFSLSWLLTYNT